ncbi:unnamed protein product, partial [Ectocarpus sp. 12 AP-2014]
FQVASAAPANKPAAASDKKPAANGKPIATAAANGEPAAGGEGGANISARFYAALYAKLLSPDLGGASNPVLFLNLVYKAIKADTEEARAAAFAKRLLQV